jgi:soluble lytic murein transglycosylase-like protein/tetratricopeptide (TPR) repeat protein
MSVRRMSIGIAIASFALLIAWTTNHQLVPEAPAAETTAIAVNIVEPPPEQGAGSNLQRMPSVLEVGGPPVPSVDRLRLLLEEGDVRRALRTAEQLVSSAQTPRERDMAAMTSGWLHRAEGRHNLAAEAFGRVRQGNGPLAPLAAYREAEQDWRRGRHEAAIENCEQYRKRWPDGDHAAHCLRILAHSHAARGNVVAARAAARAYDEAHDTGKITEQIEVAIGTRLVESDRGAAATIFRRLAVEHSAALSGRVAEEQLARLASQGVAAATIPTDADSRMKRAVSLRESGRRDAAWSAFDALRSSSDPAIRRWLEEETDRFGWQTQRWTFLVEEYGQQYGRTGDPAWSWKRYKVLARSGKFDEAATYALQMQKKHPTSRQWKRSEEEVGRTMMLAGRYPEARAQFDEVAGRGGWTGRRAAFSAAFSAFMAGEDDDAIRRFGAIVAGDPSHEVEARYWRARAYERSGNTASAEQDRQWVLETDPWSWYATLIRQKEPGKPGVGPFARDGRWAGLAEPAPPEPLLSLALEAPETGEGAGDGLSEAEAPLPAASSSAQSVPPTGPALPRVVSPAQRPAAPGFGSWTWASMAKVQYEEPPAPVLLEDPERIPPQSYRPGALWDAETARTRLRTFSEEFSGKWPELAAIHDLASVGLYDLSGPMLSEWYEKWRLAVRSRDAVAKKLSGTAPEAWRELFLAGRDHHNTARSIYGWWETFVDPELAIEAWRLGYPLAHDQPVWEHSREHGLDPYLVLGLMRQESTYNSTARSRVGARGAMQIMPRTGHLLADLAHDTEFDAGDLEDPTVAISYGIRYLGLLMQRFDGVYPLAVASYNGGPFNVSNWLTGPGMDVPLDVFVEHIPYRETRDYVKKVTEGYTAYVALYAPAGSAMVLPPTPVADRTEVVDF